MNAWIPVSAIAAAATRPASMAFNLLRSYRYRRPPMLDHPPEENALNDLLDRFSKISIRLPNPHSPSPLPPPHHPGAIPDHPNPHHYHALMKAFSRSGNPDEALRLLFEMRDSGCRPNLLCYTTVIHSMLVSGRTADAVDLFQEMLSSGIAPDVASLTVLLDIVLRLGRFELVPDRLSWMEGNGYDPDVVTYSTLVSGLCGAGRVADAYYVFVLMLKRRCAPNPLTFTPFIRFYCSRGRIGMAMSTLEWMRSLGCPADVVAYNVVIHALCAMWKFGDVELLIKDCRFNDWEPDSVTYNTYINGLCKAGRAEEGFDQLKAMLDRSLCPNSVTMSILFYCLCRNSLLCKAKFFLEKSSELGFVVGVDGYNALMSRLSDAGWWSAVLELLASVVKNGVTPDTYTFNIVINSLCKAGKFPMAKHLFYNSGFVPNIVTYNIMIHGLYLAGRIDELSSLFARMAAEKVARDSVTYNTCIDIFCKLGRFEEAIRVVKNIGDGLTTELVGHLTHGLIFGGWIDELPKLFKEMSEVKGLILDTYVFNSLIKAFCLKGCCERRYIDKVLLFLDTMLEHNNKLYASRQV